MAAAPVVGAGPTPGGGDDAVGGRRDEETTRSVHLRQVIGVLFWSLLFVFFFFFERGRERDGFVLVAVADCDVLRRSWSH